MKTAIVTSTCFLFLLSTAVSAQSTRPAGTSGTTKPDPATRAADTSADYRLVTGDKLRVEVYKDAQLSQSLQIRPDGKITLPLIGDITAAGKTSTELRNSISESLKEFITTPVVTVIVTETMPQNIFVMGEVKSPGPQPVKGEISIIQALATAGGFSDFAKKGSIRILRPGAKGTTTLLFDYDDAIKGEAKILFLRPGDTVIVP